MAQTTPPETPLPAIAAALRFSDACAIFGRAACELHDYRRRRARRKDPRRNRRADSATFVGDCASDRRSDDDSRHRTTARCRDLTRHRSERCVRRRASARRSTCGNDPADALAYRNRLAGRPTILDASGASRARSRNPAFVGTGCIDCLGPLPAPQPLQPEGVTTLAMPVTIAGPRIRQRLPALQTSPLRTWRSHRNHPCSSSMMTIRNMSADSAYSFAVPSRSTSQRGSTTTTTISIFPKNRDHHRLGWPESSAVDRFGCRTRPRCDERRSLVSKLFMLAEPRNEGIVTDVTATSPFVLRSSTTLAGELVAGAVDIRVIGGAPVTVSVIAYPPAMIGTNT